MRLRNYIKNKSEQAISGSFEENISVLEYPYDIFKKNKKAFITTSLAVISIVLLIIISGTTKIKTSEVNTVSLNTLPIASTASNRSIISIPKGTVNVNPFLPYRDTSHRNIDIPSYELIEPPEGISENSEAARVMDTIVSGILYDKYSPSAILNIEGNDYLVKKGDVVNNYKVINIAQDSVTVKLGVNVYKAGIGEILTEGTLNHNSVSNLENKFGGER